ncbi:nucleotidyltransferase domain-containing protein [Candidatus Pacearchaeota archaeon]|nr:nucleotidyltransferase domain-containing protein [Candidatus Pacearchaeota archaeon]
MIAQILNKDILKILTVFSISPGSRFARNDLKEKTNLNNVNIDKAINTLINANLIKKEKKLLSLNLDKAKPIINLISDSYKELKELPLSVYFSITDLVFFLTRLKNIDTYLFGSYAKLIYRESSDIDIAIISDKIKNEEKKELGKILKKIEKTYKKNIEIHYFSTNFYKNKKDPLVKDILKNGVKLI